MRRTVPAEIDVLDPELWLGPDRLTPADGHAEFGLDLVGRHPAAPETEDFQ